MMLGGVSCVDKCTRTLPDASRWNRRLAVFAASVKRHCQMVFSQQGEQNMTTINDLKIIGIAVRTTNSGNQSVQDIGKLWETFYAENLLGKIPNKLSTDIYAIYTDYKSDYKDEYTTLLGLQVSSLDNIPGGLIGRHFPAETFQVFTAKGQMPKAVMDAWFDIWQRDNELQRKYTYDFEHYGEKSQNGEKSEVNIHIATYRQE
jgi:predicted transcriptional regulator YdeE